jgi:hypothetical protein
MVSLFKYIRGILSRDYNVTNLTKILISLTILSKVYSQVHIAVPLELSTGGFSIPTNLEVSKNKLKLSQKFTLYSLDHPQEHYFVQHYARKNIALVAEVSALQYNNETISVLIGRDYIKSGPTVLSAPIFSFSSPSLDQLSMHVKMLVNFEFEYRLIRLDDRIMDSKTYHRWFYYRRSSLNLTKKISIGVKDAVLASGVNRGIDFKYLNPGSIFQLDQLHYNSRYKVEGANDDNQFIGFDINYLTGKGERIYLDCAVDEFQIDIKDRSHVQDVFGITLGIEKTLKTGLVSIEYFYSSPWLYTNGGSFTNLEHEGYSLGYYSPHSHGINTYLALDFKSYRLNIYSLVYQNGDQSVTTSWDSRDNNIPYYSFKNHWSTEIDVRLEFTNRTWLDHIRITKNIFDSSGFNILLGFSIVDRFLL